MNQEGVGGGERGEATDGQPGGVGVRNGQAGAEAQSWAQSGDRAKCVGGGQGFPAVKYIRNTFFRPLELPVISWLYLNTLCLLVPLSLLISL